MSPLRLGHDARMVRDMVYLRQSRRPRGADFPSSERVGLDAHPGGGARPQPAARPCEAPRLGPSGSLFREGLKAREWLLLLHERLHDVRVELPSTLGGDLGHRSLPARGGPIRPLARNRIERVRDGEDSRAERDRLPSQAVRISRSVPALVMGTNDLESFSLKERDVGKHLQPDERVQLNERPLAWAQRSALPQHFAWHADLSNIMQQEAVLEARIVQ